MKTLFPDTRAVTTGSGGWRVDGMPVSGRVSAEFVGDKESIHWNPSIDISTLGGAPVRNPFGEPALVRDVFKGACDVNGDDVGSTWGTVVILEAGEYVAMFSHLQDAPVVSEGQMLPPGAVFGHVSPSTSPRLHWSLAPAVYKGLPSYLPWAECLNPLAYCSNASQALELMSEQENEEGIS